jgi:hypothetical protein
MEKHPELQSPSQSDSSNAASNNTKSVSVAPQQERLDHSYEHVNLFELPSFLAPDLCHHLIEQSEAMQYSSIKAEYDASYREAVCISKRVFLCQSFFFVHFVGSRSRDVRASGANDLG